MNKPLCFVLIPFGKQTDAAGNIVDFDRIYREIITPALEQAGLEPIRADEESAEGVNHKPMLERLILSEYAVADLSTANANAFYGLGLRDAVRPRSTALIFAEGGRLPLDVGSLRALPYKLSADGAPASATTDSDALARCLIAAQQEAHDDMKPATDSSFYELVQDYPNPAHEKTDVFREAVDYSRKIKKRLAAARKKGIDEVRTAEKELGDLKNVEFAVLVDLLLSYRSVGGWSEMIALVRRIPRPLAVTVMVQEQYAFALNRDGKGEEAEQILNELLEKHGPSSETLGILGRVYKDRWESMVENGDALDAQPVLDTAIDTYLQGFGADLRDAYPGINAVTLMEVREPPDPRRTNILPVVRYVVEQRVAKGQADYWDYAALLEVAVLERDEHRAMKFARDALSVVRESWEPKTTLGNLRMIRKAREQRNESVEWAKEIETALAKRAQA